MPKINNKKINAGEIAIYKPRGKNVELRIRIKQQTVWLDTRQMAKVFGVNRPAVVKHIGNIYKTGELEKESTCSILEQVAKDGKIRKVNLYSLDMVISVGYRVNSQRATQFRIWAIKILRNYLVKGYVVNEKRLIEAKEKFYELQNAVAFLQKINKLFLSYQYDTINVYN